MIASDVLIVIPAYNEAEALPAVLHSIVDACAPGVAGSLGAADVLVVDDGSSDGTSRVAREAGVRTLRLPFNLGVGGAVRLGLRYAVEHRYERVVILDADGQHDPADVARLLGELDLGADMVIGSRFAAESPGYDSGAVRRRAQRLLNRVVRARTGFPATDATSGFRALDRPVIEYLAERYPVEYLADTVEVIVLVMDAGWTVREVPIGMQQRQAGRPSSRSFGLLFNYLRLLVGVCGSALVGGRSAGRP